MGSMLSGDGREAASGPQGGSLFTLHWGRAREEKRQRVLSFDCSICLEVLHQPVRTRCGHVFCQSCIATSLRNNTWTCPYCRGYLPSEGIPATDITKMMKDIYQNCTECETQVCLSEMRAHLRTCGQYIEKYGPLQEVVYPETRYPCPFCQYELDENDLLDHFLTYHRSERRAVDINIVEEVLIERVLDRSFLEYVHVNNPNTA
ncbi:E3 ubiquitin-protein ligase RNF125 [Elgaria multicarinata webbii]|uniref:E3 ubiquitin-protein ligase RNF125 n=1 Tax=Elgaria multicarinata webbii TaxID=159646 RepID=UPI002FCD51DB